MALSTTRPNGLSSTLSSLSGRWPGSDISPSAPLPPAALEARARVSVTASVKVVPPPRRAATMMSPPIARAICLTDASPRPAPPNREAMLTLACENGRNSRLTSLSERPMPLSDIAKATPTLPLAPRSGVAVSAMAPCSVNFAALSIRFSSAARSRTGSPTTNAGSFSEISTDHCSPLAAARPASESPTLRASARRSNRSCRTLARVSRLRAASTNSVARLDRCSAPALMVSAQRRSRSSRSDVDKRLLMARMPVSGVRTSWANAASAASTMPGPDTAARLRRGLVGSFLAGSFLARFFTGRFLGNAFERCTRGFVAMVPCPTVPACHVTAARVTGGFAVVTAGKLRQLHQPPDIRRSCPGRAQLTQTGGPGRFRELLPRRVRHQPMMTVNRSRQPQQRLQQPVHAGRPEQVPAPHHVRDRLQRVVDHHRQMIAGRRLLTRQDDVAPGFRPGDDGTVVAVGAFAKLGPAEIACLHAGRRHVEAKRIGHAGCDQPLALCR